MHWILQDFEDTAALADTLARLGLPYSLHKVVPFVGELTPEPEIAEAGDTILFGAYTLWRYAERHRLRPGVFRLRPFVDERPWTDAMLNGPSTARFLSLAEIPTSLAADEQAHFIRPVDDSKEIAGRVMRGAEIVAMAAKILALAPGEIPLGSLRHDTVMMLCPPRRIQREWRLWAMEGRIVTWSLYREGSRVTYRPEIDADARAFGEDLVQRNPGYAPAYVLDICRTEAGLHLLETNCINAAGLSAADLMALVTALEALAAKDGPAGIAP
ncbi:MAG: ATP-grasp domain-containing protein [Pseudomonadota bacterium]